MLSDALAIEEPLEIRLIAGGQRRTIAITMRTPGHDFELAAGFLYSEGIIHHRHDIGRITYCVDPEVDAEQRYNIVNVELRMPTLPDLPSLERHFLTNSACGVCGAASLTALQQRGYSPLTPDTILTPEQLHTLPSQLRQQQELFSTTGGLHATALFHTTPSDTTPKLLELREDVGRHNALDKLIGRMLLTDKLPLINTIALVSGRASYEIVQKCLAASIPTLCAISAPSSLAVDLARAFNITLIGFLREGRMNVYSGAERIAV